MVRAFLFDFGGVVLDIDFSRVMGVWSEYSVYSADELLKRYTQDEQYARHERGEISASEYFDHLRIELKLSASDKAIAYGWNALFVGLLDDAMTLVKRTSAQHPCYAFTNTNATHQRAWSSQFPQLSEPFQQVFVSSEMGLRKPERRAFDYIANSIGVSNSEILFFDDSVENVEGAVEAGFQAVHVRATQDIKEALLRAGAIA